MTLKCDNALLTAKHFPSLTAPISPIRLLLKRKDLELITYIIIALLILYNYSSKILIRLTNYIHLRLSRSTHESN